MNRAAAIIQHPYFARLRDALWLACLVYYILAGARHVPFHGDESTTLWMSRDYAYIFIQHDLDLVRYHDPPINETEQHMRLAAAPLPKYILGAAWHWAGFTIDDLNEQWDWGADWSYNQNNGHAPSPTLLLAARRASALFLAGGALLMFIIGLYAGGRPAAYMASLYYALNPSLLLNGRRAMLEGPTIFLALVVVLAGIWLLHKRAWWSVILLGTASGLAVASKHTNVFVVIGVFAACTIYALFLSIRSDEDDDPPRETSQTGDEHPPDDPYYLMTTLIVAGMLSIAVFYAMNPVWWVQGGEIPAERLQDTLDARTEILTTQVRLFGGYDGPLDRLAGLFRQTFIVRPQYYEDPAWAGYITNQIAAYEATRWKGISVGGSTLGGLIMLALTAAGAWSLAGDASRPIETRLVLGAWSLAVAGAILALNPLEWQRYYIPLYPVVGILASLGILWLARRAQQAVRPSA